MARPSIPTDLAERPGKRDPRPLKGLMPYMKPYAGKLALALTALSVAAVATLTLPVAIRYLIDLDATSTASDINSYFVFLMGIAVVLALATAMRYYYVTWLGERVVADIRVDVFNRMVVLGPTFYETTKTGEVLSRLTSDTTVLQSVIGSGASVALRNAFILVGGLTMLIVTSPRLTGFMVGVIIVVLLPMILFGRRVRRLSRLSQDRVADSSAIAGEVINAMQIVQAFVREAWEAARFRRAVEDSFATALRRIRARAMLTAVIILFVFGSVVAIMWLGTQSVSTGAVSGGQLGQFVIYAILTAGAFASLSEIWGEIQRAAGAMERIMELLEEKRDVRDADNPVDIGDGGGRVELDRVKFAYPSRPDEAVLDNISFDVAAGETVALVGPSGAGKTTVFSLMLRFYDPAAGSIRLDGTDIANARLDDVRGRIGIVPQETVIFSATAMENIRYGRLEATDEEVIEAAKAAMADEFLAPLPDGYDTHLGERGVRLSGGQRQRIAIARAILKNPPVLLLDEATSALDAESERKVQDALDSLMENRTTLIIAHRLATVVKADRIVVLDSGRVVASGTHEQLLASEGIYARLAALQFGESPQGDAVATMQETL
ncbi:MAG: ABC transporter transmembrane domain-containing protein [Gammaproteobacteria bacterium]